MQQCNGITVETEPVLNVTGPKKRFHLTLTQAEVLAWISFCLCCWPIGGYAIICVNKAKIAEDDEEYEKTLVCATWLGIVALAFDLVFIIGLVTLLIVIKV